MSSLIDYINQCVPLLPEEQSEILSYFQVVRYPKKTIILHAGDVCRFEGFIVSGCIKTYFIDAHGAEVILTFGTESWWVSDIASFHEQVPSTMFIETIEHSELLTLSLQAKEDLLAAYPKLEKMFRLMVQRHLASYQERLFGNIALTAEARYDNFLTRFPEIPQRVPQHLIASYLGISPEFLSRLRKRKLSK